jgi:hypothetical protein
VPTYQIGICQSSMHIRHEGVRITAPMTIVITIGHSTHTSKEFIQLLKAHLVQKLVDVRTVPRSRHNPW